MISPETPIRAAAEPRRPAAVLRLGRRVRPHGHRRLEQLAVPALRELGPRDPAVAGHVAMEHDAVRLAAHHPAGGHHAGSAAGTIPLGCPGLCRGEQHVLPVYAPHAELAAVGVDVRQLGGRVPRQALAHAVSTLHPARSRVRSQVPADRRADAPAQPRRAAAGDRRPGLAGPASRTPAHVTGRCRRPPPHLAAPRSGCRTSHAQQRPSPRRATDVTAGDRTAQTAPEEGPMPRIRRTHRARRHGR